MLSMKSRPAGTTPGPWPTVIAHGITLFAWLLFFRLGKVAFADIHPGAFDRVALVLPEIGFVLLFECFWALVSWGRAGRLWNVLVLLSHLLVYCYVVVNHGFFVNTGYRVDFDMATYSLTHLGNVGGIIAEGLTVGFWLQVVAILGGLLLAGRLAELLGHRGPKTVHPLASGLVAILGLALVAWSPAGDPYVRDLSRNDVVAFAKSTVQFALPQDQVVPRMTAPEDFYQAPRVLSPETTKRPNILLVILESTGAQASGPDFSAPDVAPNLARIASQSVVLDSAYSTVTHTSKTLVGILCGMVARVELPPYESLPKNLPLRCLPHILGEIGYRTVFLQTARATFENRPGLVENLGYQSGAYQETMFREPFEKTGYLGMDEFAMLEPALGWATSGEEPFFLTALTVTPHHPYDVPGQTSDGPEKERYLAALKHQDAFVGALYDGLQEAGALEDTLVIILGDHGEAFGEHKIYEHDAVSYEEVVWTPVLLSGPEWLEAPRRLGGLRSHLDLLPTILEVLGVSWEGTLPGRSLLSTPGHETVFVSCWDRNRCLAMRRGTMKYVHHFRKRSTEVFDLEQDPTEKLDLASTLTEIELAQIESEMRAFKLSVDAFWAQYPPQEEESK